MRPERFLGSDPAPGDLDSVDRVAGVLRSTVVALAGSRHALESLLGPHSLWHGPLVAPLTAAVAGLAARLRRLENAVVDFAHALDSWRTGLVSRQDAAAELTEAMSQLSGQADAAEQRAAVLAAARRLAAEHATDAAVLVNACDGLVEELAAAASDGDLAADLDRALTSVGAAVEAWLAESAAELLATVRSLDETAGVTAVVSALLGIEAAEQGDRTEAVRLLTANATGSHRLQAALARSWVELAPELLPQASFGSSGDPDGSLVERLRGAGAPSAEPGAR